MKTGITSITIENFKGIGEKVTIPFKPITLLFGANSAGKSTVLHAIALARSILEKGGSDFLPVECSGYTIPLGKFGDFVHQHDRTKTIAVEITYNIERDNLPISIIESEAPEVYPENFTLCLELKKEGRHTFKLLFDNQFFCDGSYGLYGLDGGMMLNVYFFERSHPLFIAAMEAIGIDTNFTPPENEIYCRDIEEYFSFILFPSFSPQNETGGNCLADSWELYGDDGPDELCNDDVGKVKKLEAFLNQSVIDPLRLIYRELSDFRFIGPLREIPESLDESGSISRLDWYTGQTAWLWCGRYYDLMDIHRENLFEMDKASEESKQLREYISRLDWMPYEFAKIGNLNISIPSKIYCKTEYFSATDKYRSSEEKNKLLLDYLGNEFGKNWALSLLEERAVLIKKESQVEVAPRSVGTGISQVIPIIAATILPGADICAFEQPELHLHPAMQCELGDLFVDGIKRHPNRVTLLETHSEHIILRLLRRMRETAAGKAPEGKELTPDDVAVLAVEAGENGTEIYEMEISEAGEFLTPWPTGFFPERMNEILGE